MTARDIQPAPGGQSIPVPQRNGSANSRGGYVSPAPRKVASTQWSPGDSVVQVRTDISAGTEELGVTGEGTMGGRRSWREAEQQASQK